MQFVELQRVLYVVNDNLSQRDLPQLQLKLEINLIEIINHSLFSPPQVKLAATALP